jgi:hypothetical protein
MSTTRALLIFGESTRRASSDKARAIVISRPAKARSPLSCKPI